MSTGVTADIDDLSEDDEASRTSAAGTAAGRFAVPDFSGKTIADRIRIDAPLAEGGMSRVFNAHQIGLNRQVAIKFMKQPEKTEEGIVWLERFRREAAVLASLSHPNLIVVHEFGDFEGFPYLLMERADGSTLSSVLREHGPVSARRIVQIGLQIAAGLEEAHSKGVVHRDLKPSNILLGSRDRVKVIDFGIASTTNQDAETSPEQLPVGSPRYMSPEQARGQGVSPATDIYSLGCVLYHAAAGAPPFSNESAAEVMHAHVHDFARPPREVSSACHVSNEFEAIIMRCLKKQPSDRFASMSALISALSATSEIAGEVSVRPQSHAKDSSRSRSRRSLAIIAALGVLLAIGWVAVTRKPAAIIESQHLPRAQTAPVSATTLPSVSPSAVPDRVIVLLDSVPTNARVERDGTLIGTTPMRVAVQRNERVRVRLSHPEYETATAELTDVELSPTVQLTHSTAEIVPIHTHSHPSNHPSSATSPAPTGTTRTRPLTDNLDPWGQ